MWTFLPARLELQRDRVRPGELVLVEYSYTMNILIVDDNDEIRALMRALLEKQGHTVVGEAGDGDEAVKAFLELRPDVVLLDIIMPGKSGMEVLEEIRGLDPEAKVFMVTAVEQDTINRRLLLVGAAGIIYKPFSSEDFKRAFQSLPPRKPAKLKKSETIESLVAGGLSKCMLRTADASSWAWELCEVSVYTGKISDAVKDAGYGHAMAAVQVNVREGALFSAALVFRSADIAFISSCFANGPLYRTGDVPELAEGLVLEIGNVILNSLANPLIQAMGKSALPSVPMLVKGGSAAVAAALGSCLNPSLNHRIISATIAMRREGRVARAGVLGVLPEALAAGLEREIKR
jgi:two-component system chemotaxis response regulator CheY